MAYQPVSVVGPRSVRHVKPQPRARQGDAKDEERRPQTQEEQKSPPSLLKEHRDLAPPISSSRILLASPRSTRDRDGRELKQHLRGWLNNRSHLGLHHQPIGLAPRTYPPSPERSKIGCPRVNHRITRDLTKKLSRTLRIGTSPRSTTWISTMSLMIQETEMRNAESSNSNKGAITRHHHRRGRPDNGHRESRALTGL
ncbi:hypothetical protein Nepgr_026123 [Nepenthes gracilis]|uniref:Uncharacterized protein n=1 Tax=Nepenthes gracilis TaxID=150966 RepID=A0AAD3T7A4_NEPGR|nr:hypothetical protein Nepgr_026123 [Nepenthes gracilis]